MTVTIVWIHSTTRQKQGQRSQSHELFHHVTFNIKMVRSLKLRCRFCDHDLSNMMWPATQTKSLLPNLIAGFAYFWCPEPESNRYASLKAADFKSAVSTNFTIGAHFLPGASTQREVLHQPQGQGNKKGKHLLPFSKSGAGKRVRTVDLYLGKVSLYQLSYSRIA